MSSWAEFETAEPEFAAQVRQVLDAHKHKTIATLRKDGSPRISGIEAEIAGGELTFGSMPGAMKGRDLLRDGRFALHSASEDPPEDDPASWTGDVKVSGTAIPMDASGHDAFRADISSVTLTKVVRTPDGERLQIQTWSPARGLRTTTR